MNLTFIFHRKDNERLFELREATTGRDGVECGSEKSQFGGYRATCKRGSKSVYSGGTTYKDAATAKKEAEVYADAYYGHGDRAAQRAVQDFKKKNSSKLFKESVEIEESTKKYAKTLQDISDKAKKDQLSSKDLETLGKLAQLMKTANEGLEEGKLPPHLAKFFDKDGNLNKDAEERVKKGRKAKGLDQYTGKKVKKEEVEESLSAMIKKKHDKTKKDQEDAKKNMALKSRLKKSGIHVKEARIK